jgi:hypothetical protein
MLLVGHVGMEGRRRGRDLFVSEPQGRRGAHHRHLAVHPAGAAGDLLIEERNTGEHRFDAVIRRYIQHCDERQNQQQAAALI